MTPRHLEHLFHPRRIAIIGASNRPGSVGGALVDNLKDSFTGALDLVHPSHTEIHGLPVVRRIEDLDAAPDLAIVATPPDTVPGVVSLLGARGTRAVVVVASGFENAGPQLMADLGRAAFAHDVRIVGPSSVGIIVPKQGMNASFAVGMPKPGKLALVSQSGAIMGAVIDWALQERIGFSRLISLGQKSDVDFADVVDHIASDVHTRAILLCIEETANARKFMSALRAGARSRPIVALKVGRSHKARTTDPDDALARQEAAVFSAALRRAGVLQVDDLEQLFGAGEILGRVRSVPGNRVAVLTNGGGVGVLAAERYLDLDGRLADLSAETRATLADILPPATRAENPVDLLGDADANRYKAVAEALLEDKGVDGLIIVHCPTKLADSNAIAEALSGPVQAAARKVWPSKPALVVWLGEARHSPQREAMEEAGLPTFRTPSAAAEAFSHLLHHDTAQAQLMQTPPAVIGASDADIALAKGLVAAALAEGQTTLPVSDQTALLSSFGIPCFEDSKEAQTVPGGLALAAGFVDDRVFGPAIYLGLALGRGGGMAHGHPIAFALPPLNTLLAEELITRSGFDRLFAHDTESVAGQPVRGALSDMLVRLAQVSHDLRDVRSLDGDVMLTADGLRFAPRAMTLAEERRIDRHGVNPRFAIRPYPSQWESEIALKGGRKIALRPIRPDDEELYRDFLGAMDKNDLRLRFFTPNPNLSHDFLARLTQIDYARSMAFIALEPETGALMGVVRLHVEPNGARGEYAVLVRSGLKGLGLGWQLMQHIIDYGRYVGISEIYGEVLKENSTMLAMCTALGFASMVDADDPAIMHVTLDLSDQAGAGAP